MFQREKFAAHNVNAVAAGRVEGPDTIKQITNRCIRIVKDIEAELSGCALCRQYKENFVHVGVLISADLALVHAQYYSAPRFSQLISVMSFPSCFIMPTAVKIAIFLVRLQSFHAPSNFDQPKKLVLECFNPIVDASSGRNLILAMVYGLETPFKPFFVSHFPFIFFLFSVSIKVSPTYRRNVRVLAVFNMLKFICGICGHASNIWHRYGKGYFQTLLSCIERLLAFLNVKNLVLSAAEEAESIWTDKFGFSMMKPDQVSFI
ncbi:hypothetical protein VNO80_04154 [Phaseolus coccineus]|uniref:Increased DNA methylation 1 C-terminal domain-containing protein n=1 Tax=Phaseolus coccineus TaxID=3886 RepID=A0AAN9RRU5_PHACN